MSACVLDTDVVIAVLDRSDAHHTDAANAVSELIEDRVELLLSTINYAEALVRPAEHERMLKAAVDAMNTIGVQVTAPSAAIARDAARFRSRRISLADGFALATARAHSATVASFDNRVRRAMVDLGLEAPAQLR